MNETIARPFRLRLNLQLFAGDSGGSSGSGGDEGDESNGGGAGGGEKTFTQAELDQHVQQRVARAERAAQKALAKELGYDSVEAMQAALKKPEGGSKGKGDDGKGIDPADVEKLLDERLKEREKEQEKNVFNRELRADVKVFAAELGFADFEDAVALGDFSKVKRNDKGDLEGVKEVLEELLKKKPHLGKQKPGTGAFGANVSGGGSGGNDKKDRLERMKKLAQETGTAAPAANDPWKR